MMSWIPLESNPDVMTTFLHKLGVPKEWSIIDVYGLEPDLLALVPKPVLAVILLYPLRKKTGNGLESEEDVKESDTSNPSLKDPSVYHMKQYIHNACGTIALIHSIGNNLDRINLQDGVLYKFLNESKDLSFSERGELLMKSQDIGNTHEELAHEGQTEVPSQETPIYHHFIAFIQRNGVLYELDGRKSGPIEHGATSPETLLEDAARVCKEYMARDPEEVCFTVVALVNSDAEAF
nr:ubiquitin carboxyl-terminal hydrolase isoform X1 [Osmia lignaria]